jgi:hypothetical protein
MIFLVADKRRGNCPAPGTLNAQLAEGLNWRSAMKKWMISIAAVAAISSYSPTPSLAQGVAVEVPGVGVRIGEPPRRERVRREEWREREVRGNCRTVTVTEDTPTGTRTRSKRECD